MAIKAQKEFTLTDDFSKGYQARRDITTLSQGILVKGSQNVVTNTSGRVGIVRGYELDGSASVIEAGIESAYDVEMNFGVTRHLKSYTDPTTSKGVLQFRNVDSDGVVTWNTLKDDLNRGLIRYTRFFDFNAEKNDLILMVDNTPTVKEWSGAVTTFASATANTITKEDTSTWGEIGFYALANKKVMLGGIEYTYTAGEGTTTLTGVTPDPTAGGHSVGDLIFQSVVTVANSAITVLPDSLPNSYIATLKNQIYYASEIENEVYVSKTNDYKDCTVSTPRVVGEGGLLHLDSIVKGFVPQENSMYITCGDNQWYNTGIILSADNTKESLKAERLKTASKQGSFSQELITKDKNDIIFVSKEPVLTTLGRVVDVDTIPQSMDISFPIVDDFNVYDFTGGSAKYHKNFIYVSVPQEGVIRIYNQTLANTTKAINQYWEAPITYPIAMFSVIDGDLYGHSFSNTETYKLFTGGSFNKAPYTAKAKFSYTNYGSRTSEKAFNEFYTEGYISGNTVPLTLGVTYEIDGCSSLKEFDINGNNSQYVCGHKSDSPLGKTPLGVNPLGGDKDSIPTLPPKFRVVHTFPSTYFYEHNVSYTTSGIDRDWEILAFGVKLIEGKDLNNSIKV